jgi:RNA recognition motif-containing protein
MLQFLIKVLFCLRYITYSKEDEAIRCIQNVHGFVLEGRPLRYRYLLLLTRLTHVLGLAYWCFNVFGLYISGLVLEPQNIVMHGSEIRYEN